MSVGYLLGDPKFAAFDANGDPLVGGKLYSYNVGLATAKATYSDLALTVPNTNPVVLDSRGEAAVYLDGATKLILKTSADVVIWSWTTAGSVGGEFLAANLPAATELAQGAVELATDAETIAGIDTGRVTTPAGIASLLADITATVAEQKTGTSTTSFVTSGRQHQHMSAVKALAIFNAAGGLWYTPYNVTDVTDVGAGSWKVNYTTTIDTARFPIVSIGGDTGAAIKIAAIKAETSAYLHVVSMINAGTLTDPTVDIITCAVFGEI